MARFSQQGKTASGAVVEQSAGQVYVKLSITRLWLDQAADFQRGRGLAGLLGVVEQSGARGRGVDREATVPHYRALVARPETAARGFFKTSGRPDEWV